jgi:hypothetical protein
MVWALTSSAQFCAGAATACRCCQANRSGALPRYGGSDEGDSDTDYSTAVRLGDRDQHQFANGSTITLPISRAPGIAYEGFSYGSDSPATFPANVTGYNAGGKVLATHEVDASPLCTAAKPDCFK